MFPKRGAFAAFITTVLLVLVLTVKTPDQLPQDDSGAFAPQSETPSLVAYVESQTSNAGAPASGGQSDHPSPAASSGQPGGPNQTQTGGTNAQATPPPAGVPNATNPPTGSASAPPNPASNPAPAATPPPTAAPTKSLTGAFDGTTVQMKYGPVQVRVVYSGGKITDVIALQTPTADSRSKQIAQRAAPILRSEALSAQSATIDTVSGATYTSTAYKSSLQSAIDKAKA